MRPRVGHIQFLNCYPLYYGLVKNDVLLDVELTKGTPAELNRWLPEGRLDISPISSIEYARHQDDLLLLPGLSISCNGPVKSVYLVSRRPIAGLDKQPLALTNTSATSQALLKIILRDRYQLGPEYFTCPPELPDMLREAEAALLIGDPALQAAYRKSEDLALYDLGQEWLAMTGRKMVFAVWAVRREFAQNQPQLVRDVCRSLLGSMRYSLDRLGTVAREAAKWEIYDAAFLEDYFLSLEFDFSGEQQAGLLEYYRRAHTLEVCPPVTRLNFAEV
ncbi:menaquinone biosynthetic enzyme MqnA/MqnD family protein [Acetonema longum]|uniref:Chorismate dehydratase n=1 Tax=Acetonema longum DSM 6540 TaxID=1009370 RepID=F7NGH4_9FIRM|nr:menaquinone biosynthesis protein [Acetonema longum]EGO64778.1 hypothetical protein ALO_05810 [Acetonema longum DSM 6540]